MCRNVSMIRAHLSFHCGLKNIFQEMSRVIAKPQIVLTKQKEDDSNGQRDTYLKESSETENRPYWSWFLLRNDSPEAKQMLHYDLHNCFKKNVHINIICIYNVK